MPDEVIYPEDGGPMPPAQGYPGPRAAAQWLNQFATGVAYQAAPGALLWALWPNTQFPADPG